MIQWIKRLRSTEKGKIAFKFILYCTFFFFVLALCIAYRTPVNVGYGNHQSASGRPESQTLKEDTHEPTYFEKQNLFKDKYDFTYEVKSPSGVVNYMGEYDHGFITGYKESDAELIRYRVVDGKAYKTDLSEEEEYPTLYEDFEANFFDISSLFTRLNTQSATINRTESGKIYNYTFEGVTYKVTTSAKVIEKIEINQQDIVYTFTFTF